MSSIALKAFDFEDGGKVFSCRVEEQRRDRPETWWWFGVSGDRNRYAPFRAEIDDTEDSVRTRVVAYYTERMAPRVFTSWRDRGAPRKQV
jgi:hypothetical protein